MGYWRKHPRKDLEEVLERFDAAGWRIDDSGAYYKVLCACGSHQRRIHMTPSSPYYGNHALQWLKKQPCTPSKEGKR